MANASISGLVSGLDTATIIDQLMQLEAAPQNRLKSQQDTQKKVVTALQALNTDASLLASRAAALAKPESWQTLKGTASSSDVSVSVGTGAATAAFQVKVVSLAARHQLGFTNAAALTDVVTSGSAVRITSHDGTVHDLTTGGGTLQEVVTAINAATATTGVSATAVKVADGSYRLLAQSTATGATTDFTLTNTDGSTLLGGAAVSAGSDAEINLGVGIAAKSATNTFTNLTPGVSLTLSGSATIGATTGVTVAQDTATAKAGLKDLVAQVNRLLSTIDTQTAGSTSTTSAGILAGDATARSLRDALAETIFGDGTTSMASLGLQTDKTGMLVFDDVAFDKAYAADPAGTAAKFTSGASTATDGWLARVATVAKAASDSTTGTLSQAITGRNSTISEMDKSIANWDLRLDLRRTSLQQQYTALETALSSMQSQGTWLAGQIASLPKSS